MSAGAIAIFVKTPRFSPVKTRLAATLGRTLAERTHLLCASAVHSVVEEAVLSGLPVQPYWAVAERAALKSRVWRGAPKIWQGEGSLGERLAKVYDLLIGLHRFVILLGADTPQLCVEELGVAISALAPARSFPNRFVLGPAVDGGFYLFGGTQILPRETLAQVSYSSSETLRELVRAVTPLGEAQFLQPMHDLDDASALQPIRLALEHLLEPTLAQMACARFLSQLAGCGGEPCARAP